MTQALLGRTSGRTKFPEKELTEELRKMPDEECQKLSEWRARHPVKRAW
ncbi:hypothetical protein ACFLQU_04145 [Verrucomicrobiota bacterium]